MAAQRRAPTAKCGQRKWPTFSKLTQGKNSELLSPPGHVAELAKAISSQATLFNTIYSACRFGGDRALS